MAETVKPRPHEPVEQESRICFALMWFATEQEAEEVAAWVHERGYTYNGGWFHGMPCGREKHFDFEKDGRKLYAVSH